MQRPVLIVLHQQHSTPGRLGHALQQLGYTLDVRRPRFSDPLPATMAEHSAAYYPVRPTRAGLAVVETWPECVYQWHREGFDLPYGTELLAEGDTFEVLAIRFGRAFALQFHPEVTHAMIHKWTTHGHDRMAMPGAKPRHTHFDDRAVYDYSARAWLKIFLERWLGGAKECVGQSLMAAAD